MCLIIHIVPFYSYKLWNISIQRNENSFFTYYLKVVLDHPISHYSFLYRSSLVSRNLLYPEKFLAAPLHEEITLKSMSQTKKKCDFFVLSRSYLWMIWRCHGILRVYRYYFCLEPTAGKDTWIRTTSVTVMVILFKSNILKVTWSQLCSKVLLKNY